MYKKNCFFAKKINEMNRIKFFLSFMSAALLGGFLALFLYFTFEKKELKKEVPFQWDKVSNKNFVRQVDFSNKNLDFTSAAEKTVNAVVHVKIRSQLPTYDNPIYNFLFGRPSPPQEELPIVSAGSGVIISNDGYIVTNNHVIKDADLLEVTLNDRRTFEAKVIGADPTTDIALIKIEGKNFPYLTWGDSEQLKVGEWVLAVGNPFNLASTVTAGIVSAKSRSINILNRKTAIEAFIQTDAAVNPGNSGGALVNTKGELVGINTAIASPTGSFSGYSFAVPERIARKIVADLIEFGTVQRAFIGVSIAEVTSPEAQQNGITTTNGVYVFSVTEDGAAKEAGIKAGDVILKIGNNSVNTTSELQAQVGQYRPGNEIEVTVLRKKKKRKILLTLRNINGSTQTKNVNATVQLFGAELKSVSPSELHKWNLKSGGVKVEKLSKGKFKLAGIKEGFIITSVNRKRISNTEEFIYIIKNSQGGVYLEGIYSNGSSAYYAFGI